MLVEFYAREVVAQQKLRDGEEQRCQRQEAEAEAAAVSAAGAGHSPGGSREDVTMRYRTGSMTA